MNERFNRFRRNEKPIEEPTKKREMIKNDVDLDLSIDQHNLNQELMDQPLLYKKYSELDSEAQKAVKFTALKLSQVKASSHLKHAQKGLKVKDVESLVDIDEEVIELQTKLIELEETADKIRGALKACHQRHEALKDLCANKRKELID